MNSSCVRVVLVFQTACLSIAIGSAYAANDQIGDFRFQSDTYATNTAVETFTEQTRTAQAALDNVTLPRIQSTVTGLSQVANMVVLPQMGSTQEADIELQTFSTSTSFRNLNRYRADQDGPDGPGTGAQQVGVVQWHFDLTPIGSYLTTEQRNLTALDLDFTVDPSDDSKLYDLLLSYTNVAQSITLKNISTTITDSPSTGGPRENYTNIWWPLHDNSSPKGDYDGSGLVDGGDYGLWRAAFGSTTDLAADGNGDGVVDAADYVMWRTDLGETRHVAPDEGDIFGGSFYVIGKDRAGNQGIEVGDPVLHINLLPLYNQGIREFNLILTSGDFLLSRRLNANIGSGISISSVSIGAAVVNSVPEPSTLLVLGSNFFWAPLTLRRAVYGKGRRNR